VPRGQSAGGRQQEAVQTLNLSGLRIILPSMLGKIAAVAGEI
jgi:hypothetical protein